jgi:hypothetical protein
MSAVRNWLKGIGLGGYPDAFDANEMDMVSLRHLDDELLVDSTILSEREPENVH